MGERKGVGLSQEEDGSLLRRRLRLACLRHNEREKRDLELGLGLDGTRLWEGGLQSGSLWLFVALCGRLFPVVPTIPQTPSEI